MAEYLANALAEPERSYATAAVEIAQPLAQVSYRLAQVECAVRDGNVDAALGEIRTARRIIADALVPLRRQHAEEVRLSDCRRGGGWTGSVIGKLCAAPAGGGGATGLIEYLVGYAIAEKGATRDEIVDALEAVYAEAETRRDLGMDAVWSPTAGGGIRPSSILARNCASFLTANLEIDADAARNPGVRSSAMHFVWSWNTRESGMLTDEQAHEYAQKVLVKLNLAHHRSATVVHRDTIVYDRNADGSLRLDERGNRIVRDGNLHVHCAVGAVDPHLGLAYDRTGLHRRMAWAEREVELERGLDHDRGLAVVQDAGLESAHVRWADKHELAAWRAQRKEERLVRQERRSFEGYRERDVTFDRFVDATVAPRLRAAIDLAHQRGATPEWATLHAVAARYGCELTVNGDGEVLVRDVGTGELRVEHERRQRDARGALKEKGVDPAEIDERLAELRAEHERMETLERERKRGTGVTVLLRAVLPDVLSDLGGFADLDASERQIIDRVASHPAIVLVDVTAQTSTFTREDVDLWLASRISDPVEIERLGDLVVRLDSVRVLSADTAQALMTTTEVLQIEDKLAADAATLAATPSPLTRFDIDDAITAYEREESNRRLTPFRLSAEQRDALRRLSCGSLVAIDGLPGVGKTTIQGAVRLLGEVTGREVVGLTLSQAAAERLEAEAGFHCVNTARARILEEGHKLVIPHNGIVVVDEAAMVDSRANGRILDLARQRGSVVIEIGDVRQLQPIDFGASFRIVRDASRAAGTYAELREIQRQQRPWHRHAVEQLADALVEHDELSRLAKVREALQILEDHGAITWAEDRSAAIDAAIAQAQAHHAAGHDTLAMAADKDTVRHLSEEDRRRQGRHGGLRYVTNGGVREFTVGDRLMFLENNLGKRGLGVRNGDRGTVLQAKPNRIVVQIDGANARTVTFAPRTYRSFDYANACTVHKAQGASVDAALSVIDRSASAELLFVAASRSKRALDIVVPRSAFRDLSELADHVSERISLKTTTQTYDEVLERTGGKQTIRIRNIEAQREAAAPRRLYEADVVEPVRAIQADRVRKARDEYRRANEEIAHSTFSIEEKLDAGREALRSMRRSIASVYRDLRPQPFAEWLRDRELSRDRAAQVGEEKERRQAQRQRREHESRFDSLVELEPDLRDSRWIER